MSLATLDIEHDPELRYRKPGESQTERLLRAVDELRTELDTANDEVAKYYDEAERMGTEAQELRDELKFLKRTVIESLESVIDGLDA